MTKNQFIKTLRASLRGLPAAQLDDITADYEEYFADGIANGRSEAQIADGLGDPAQIAKELLCEMRIQAWESKKSFGNLGRVVLAIVALGGLNLFLSIPMLVIMCLLTASYMVSVALILVGFAALVSYIPGLDFLVKLDTDVDAGQAVADIGRTMADAGQAVADAKKGGDGGQHIVIDKGGKHIEIDGQNVSTTDADGRSVKITKDDSGHVEIHVHDPKKDKDVDIRGKDEDKDAADDDEDDTDEDVADIKEALSGHGLHLGVGFLDGISLGVARAALAVGGLISGGLLLLINLWLTRLLVGWFLRYAKLNYSLIKGE